MPRKLAHVSSRKVAANRQNALKSTGPKTLEGKAYSRRNALKNGLFAMDLYIADLTKWEDHDEYQKLLQRRKATGALKEKSLLAQSGRLDIPHMVEHGEQSAVF